MRRMLSRSAALALITLLAGAAFTPAQTIFKTAKLGGGVMLADHKTFVVTLPGQATLLYIDTLIDKELKRVEVEFQPTVLARQKDKLFVATKGSATIHVLDADSAKEVKEIKIAGEPVQSIACHPEKGMIYAVALDNVIHAIDPDKLEVHKTKGKGQMIAVDQTEGKFLYTGIQRPIREQLVVEESGKKLRISLALTGARAVMLKYQVDGADLKLVAANDNAAINGNSLGLSPDGKRIAMSGGGGWRSLKDAKANYAIAVFDTADMKTMLGQVETGPYPAAIAFHPVLPLGAAFRQSSAIHIFSAKSFVKKDVFKIKNAGSPLLVFGGLGTKLIYCCTPGIGGDDFSTIHLFSLSLSDQDRAALKKAYADKK